MDNLNNENIFSKLISNDNENTEINREKQIENKMHERTKIFKPKSYNNQIEYNENNILSIRKQNREDLFAMRRDSTIKDKKLNNKSSLEDYIQIDKNLYKECYELEINNVILVTLINRMTI